MTVSISSINIINNIKYIELIAAIAGTVYYYKYKHTSLKYFIYILWYITISEFFASYIYSHKIDTFLYLDEKGLRYNLWVLNLLYFIFFNVVLYIYLKLIKNKKYQFWIRIFMVSYSIISILNWIFVQNFGLEMSELPFVSGSFFLIISIVFYFIELLKSDKIVVFHRLLPFWISVGLLLFHTGTIPFSINWNSYAQMTYIHDLYYINFILATTMYLIFTFGFIWSKKQ